MNQMVRGQVCSVILSNRQKGCGVITLKHYLSADERWWKCGGREEVGEAAVATFCFSMIYRYIHCVLMKYLKYKPFV